MYGDDELPGKPWKVRGEATAARDGAGGHRIEFDFRTKALRTKDRYVARWIPAERVIAWDDGNRWQDACTREPALNISHPISSYFRYLLCVVI